MSKILTEKPISQSQIDAWKKEFKNVFAIQVDDENGLVNMVEGEPLRKVITGYFRRPSMNELGLATQGKDTTAFNAGNVMYNTCLLGGHPAFDNDDEIKLSAMAQFKDIIKTREAIIKKL